MQQTSDRLPSFFPKAFASSHFTRWLTLLLGGALGAASLSLWADTEPVPVGPPVVARHQFVPPATGLTPAQLARLERFRNFQIQGVCGGESDLARLSSFGVNTIRNYTIPSAEATLRLLDEAHRHGMKVIVSEWMPHQGSNRGNYNSTWNYDYDEKGEELYQNFIAKLEGIGDHPALLMWGLGNEVHLDEPYLRTVNRISLAIHERFPLHLTSLTMINAKPDQIAKIKELAPDIDVLGVQSYSPGAVRGSIRNAEEHWGRAFYVSEFNGKGPWNFAKTEWGEPYDEPLTVKVADLWTSYRDINASSLCLGSTIFVWSHYMEDRPTYFSLLLTEHPDGNKNRKEPLPVFLTPQAEVMIENFTRRPITGNRSPLVTSLKYADGARERRAYPREVVHLKVEATDADRDRLEFTAWILNREKRNTRAIAGPFAVTPEGEVAVPVPNELGPYLIMVYAFDRQGGASAMTIPVLVEVPAPAAAPAASAPAAVPSSAPASPAPAPAP